MRKFIICLSLLATACAPAPNTIVQGNPNATTALLALPDAQFAAQTELAQQVANACPTLGFNQRFAEGLVNFRERSRVNIRAIELERDVAMRSLQARYNVTFDQGNLCAVGEGEIARQSPLSAILVPI